MTPPLRVCVQPLTLAASFGRGSVKQLISQRPESEFSHSLLRAHVERNKETR